MLRAGDELLHTQGGNDNPYNQDNETTWLEDRGPGGRALYVIANAGPTPVPCVLQAAPRRWHLAVDTSLPSPDDIELERARVLPHPSYTVAERSVVVLIEAR